MTWSEKNGFCLLAENDSEYSIKAVRAGNLIGILKDPRYFSLVCVPPNRLAGPCRRVLTKVLGKYGSLDVKGIKLVDLVNNVPEFPKERKDWENIIVK